MFVIYMWRTKKMVEKDTLRVRYWTGIFIFGFIPVIIINTGVAYF